MRFYQPVITYGLNVVQAPSVDPCSIRVPSLSRTGWSQSPKFARIAYGRNAFQLRIEWSQYPLDAQHEELNFLQQPRHYNQEYSLVLLLMSTFQDQGTCLIFCRQERGQVNVWSHHPFD